MNKKLIPLKKHIDRFIRLEASGGIILFFMAVLAIILRNSPVQQYYLNFLHATITVSLGHLSLSMPFLLWINDAFMAIFFLLVGLEIKREVLQGELSSWNKALFPAVGAVGGMLVPALIYVYFNWGNLTALQGWAIPTATDIAFSLAVLSLLGSRIPNSLKVFLMALAIFDDIGAIAVIGVFYTKKIWLWPLIFSVMLILLLTLFNRLNIVRRAPYFIVGIALWICVLKSGVHATLTGVLLALTIPLRSGQFSKYSPVHELEKDLHPWVAYAILPLFAFANAGIPLHGFAWSRFRDPICFGIIFGLFIGKQLGIWGTTMLSVRCGLVKMPKKVSALGVYGIAVIAGVGFTMSLFIGTLAFESTEIHLSLIQVGVVIGSLLSGLMGYSLLRYLYR